MSTMVQNGLKSYIHRLVIIMPQMEHQLMITTPMLRYNSSQSSSSSNSTGKYQTPSFISKKNVATTTKSRATEALANPFETETSSLTKSTIKNGVKLPSNMLFRSATSDRSTMTFSCNESQVDSISTRPLILLFAWMLSKNKHIDKYREFWTSRGYDILTVQTKPLDLLLPTIGGKKVAENVLNLLSKVKYDQMVIHAFSVGGYQLGEFLCLLSNESRNGNPDAQRVNQAMKGWIIDSCVFADSCPPGLSKAITHHPTIQPMLEKGIEHFLQITHSFTLDRYNMLSKYLFGNETKVPSLLLFSRDDYVSSVETNFRLAKGFEDNGVKTRTRCWEKSVHVLHYREHPEEYEYEIDRFIYELPTITKAPKRAPIVPSTVNEPF